MKALHPNAKVPKTNGFVLKEVPSSYRRKKASTNRALSEGGLGEAVVEAVKKKFGVDGSERVLESFRRIREGIEFEKMHEGKGLQVSEIRPWSWMPC